MATFVTRSGSAQPPLVAARHQQILQRSLLCGRRLVTAREGMATTTRTHATPAAQHKAPVKVFFKREGTEHQAQPGEFLADVAARSGVELELGCNQGSCGVCEMELQKFSWSPDSQQLVGSGPQVVRTCIARVPDGEYSVVELAPLADDLVWDVDGFDT